MSPKPNVSPASPEEESEPKVSNEEEDLRLPSSNWKNMEKVSTSRGGRPIVTSTLGNLFKFVGDENDKPLPTAYDWLAVKRKADNLGSHWRVHDKLYDLKPFIDKHPGGRDWIQVTQGTDVTEAFEASHILNFERVEKVLAKYYVGDIATPRNSPYTFKENGFYRTLKRRVEPVLKEVGTGPSRRILLMQDSLAVGYLVTSLFGAWTGSSWIQIVAGILLGMTICAAHNFLHMKDTWRRFYFDLCPMTSLEFRITHALSHHLFPNTILDYEVTALQPFLELLPNRPKTLFQRYGSLLYSHLVYTQAMIQDIGKRVYLLSTGRVKVRAENALIFIQLGAFIALSNSLMSGFLCWFLIYSAASYWLMIVGLNAAHHHPACFHDGDEGRIDPDFGLCQLDATLDKADDFHKTEFAVLTTFGNHPLHHLFPSVCHSKLPFLKPILDQVLQEFMEKNRFASQLELFVGTHRQAGRIRPWSHKRQMDYKFGEY